MVLASICLLSVAGPAGGHPAAGAPTRSLTFDERVDAQEAIERLYYSHQIGATKPFEEAVPRAALEAKVRRSLGESAALQRLWETPITTPDLERELVRMERGSRLRDRLAAIERALGGDRRLLRECLARPALASRLARNRFDFDPSIHAAARQEEEELRERLRTGALPAPVGAIGTVSERRDAFVIQVVPAESTGSTSLTTYTVPKISWDEWWRRRGPAFEAAALAEAPDAVGDRASDRAATAAAEAAPAPMTGAEGCEPGDFWSNGSLNIAPSPGTYVGVWTGTEMIVWGDTGVAEYPRSGGRYDPVTDNWRPTSIEGLPPKGGPYAAIWTGAEMIVWGLSDGGGISAGRYDPSHDTWSPVSGTGAPSPRTDFTLLWTGTRMIVWGGISTSGGTNTWPVPGGVYDPARDLWSGTSVTNAPAGRQGHVAVWTGREMLVWGGSGEGGPLDSGGRYDPDSDSWTAISRSAAPAGGYGRTAVWTGREMIVWGSAPQLNSFNSGGRYDPAADSWTAMPPPPGPDLRFEHSAVWTGSEMIVWGGTGGVSLFHPLDTGARYNPATNSWTPTSTTGAPAGRSMNIAVWTGSRMIVWGGSGEKPLNTGGQYDPVTDIWEPTFTSNAPSERYDHSAVWTGNHVIVWGGVVPSGTVNTGGRYDPATDTWSPTSLDGAPAARVGHTAIWSGDRMIVWGGRAAPGQSVLESGGRYDPITDTWSPTSAEGAPAGRAEHTAVWDGTRMIVWGGNTQSTRVNSGGRYDPATDTWTPTAIAGAPAGRAYHNAVWTGHEMIVWDGVEAFIAPASGGRYDPAADTWSAVSTLDAPEHRFGSSAVWTGTRLIVWGGTMDSTVVSTGGQYDPDTDTWSPTSTTYAPEGRSEHTVVWTGTEMIVWGGTGPATWLNSGGRYDPLQDRWAPASQDGAPAARIGHTAVWTGLEMIVWGGTGLGIGNSGGSYVAGSEPLIVHAGPDQAAECAAPVGTTVVLHGTGSGCGSLTFTWTGPFAEGGGSVPGVDAMVTLAPGRSLLTLTIEDGIGQKRADTVEVIVQDTLPPALTLRADPPALWPPNHRMVPVRIFPVVLDRCDPNPSIVLESVDSSEPDDAPGVSDGSTTGDIRRAEPGTADFQVDLRAERDRRGPGRLYTLHYRAVDAAGNATPAVAAVTVPLTARDRRPPPSP